MSNGAADATRSGARRIAPLIVVAVVVLDQLTKSWIVATHSDSPLRIIGHDVEFRVARNSGGAFSTFTNATVVLAVLAIGLTIWLVRTLRRTTDAWTVVALSLVLGGALGNLCDRLMLGHVIDFVQLHAGGYYWPAFNVADSAITVGVALLLWDGLATRQAKDAKELKA